MAVRALASSECGERKGAGKSHEFPVSHRTEGCVFGSEARLPEGAIYEKLFLAGMMGLTGSPDLASSLLRSANGS
jgi:hypothetical protein